MEEKYAFQNCQKIVVFKDNNTKVLLAKRVGEKDFDEIYSFIGGKMETKDEEILEGLRREKNEEMGEDFKIKIYPIFNTMNFYIKKDGSHMILPHYYARYESGEIKLNEEYSEYKWVEIEKLSEFGPKVFTVELMVKNLLRLVEVMKEDELVLI
jgi:ADP-ribose pyrophosphatase YjhB (NUDIX family)